MWALRPSYYDNDTPIDLRKKVVLQRDSEEQRVSRGPENTLPAKDESSHVYSRERWHQQAILPVNNLYPFMSERYGVRCSLVSSGEIRDRTPEYRPSSRGTLETAIRKLHYSRLRSSAGNPKRRSRSTDSALHNEKQKNSRKTGLSRSHSCSEISERKTTPQSRRSSGYASDGAAPPGRKLNEYLFSSENSAYVHSSPHTNHVTQQPSRYIAGAKKRKSFVPINGDRAPSPRRQTKSPVEHHHYEDYYQHPEVLLRRQMQHSHNSSPYLLHVYDYYQQLVQRLRDHSASPVRRPDFVSPSPPDDDMPPDMQRKRPCRALTGKHVKQGTGASMSILLTLRQKIQERQKAREQQPRDSMGPKNPPRKNTSKKSKHNSKNPVSKVQNC